MMERQEEEHAAGALEFETADLMRGDNFDGPEASYQSCCAELEIHEMFHDV